MTLFVAFLKGINVGGHHIVKKETLQEVFEQLGFEEVATYKQSGNVVFEAGSIDPAVGTKIETALRKKLGYEVPVFLRTIPDLRKMIELERRVKEGSSSLVTMLPSPPGKFPFRLPTTIPGSSAEVVSAGGTEVFSVTHGGGESALPNQFLESKLGVKATTRNMNVIREIVEKFGDEA